jgi:anti-sigma factor ChrR (cupin superfamily)
MDDRYPEIYLQLKNAQGNRLTVTGASILLPELLAALSARGRRLRMAGVELRAVELQPQAGVEGPTEPAGEPSD